MKSQIKKLILFISAVVMLTVVMCFGVSALEATGQCGENVYYTFDSTFGLLKISGEGEIEYDEEIVSEFCGNTDIRNVVIEKGITLISSGAFSDCVNLESVSIADTVEVIGSRAFYNCTNLKAVQFKEGLTTILSEAFYGCEKLVDIELPDTVKTIDNSVFYDCKSIGSVVIPNGIEHIGWDAFGNCTDLNTIIIPNRYFKICGDAFKNTGYYNNSDNWYNGILYLGNYAIAGSNDLTECEIRTGTKYISHAAFYDRDNLIAVKLPNGVEKIDEFSFWNCDNLKNVNIPDSVNFLGMRTFEYCKSLTDISIPDGIIELYECTFRGCESLKEVTFTNSVKNIYLYTFAETDITDVYFYGTVEDWKKINNESGFGLNATVHYFSNEKEAITDSKSGIYVGYAPDVFDNNVDFVVEENAEEGVFAIKDEFGRYVSYDLYFECDGEKVQPDGTVNVKIPLPEGFDADTCTVYYVDGNGNKTKIDCIVEDGFVEFYTNHFSIYVLVDESSRIEVPTTEPDEPATEPEQPDNSKDCSCNCHKGGL